MQQLGIGIRLDLVDNTGGAATRILQMYDRLQTGAQQTARAFDDMQSSMNAAFALIGGGYAFIQLGDAVQRGGQAIISTMSRIGKAVLNTGAEFENYRVSLKALYKDFQNGTNLGAQKVAWGMDFAARSPFDAAEVMQSMIGFKAIGIEVDKMMESLNGKMKPFMEYISDLAILRPDQGLSGILVAVRELMGGSSISFKRRLDIDPEAVLGRSLGSTPEERMKDVVELAQRLAPDLTEAVYGTWNQMLGNMRDSMIKFLLGIADSGAFDAAKKTLTDLIETFQGITNNEERLTKFTKTLSSAFEMIWKPIDWAVRAGMRFVQWIEDLSAEHPTIAKLITAFTAFTGVAMVGTGLLLKFSGGIMTTVSSLVLMYDAFQRLKKDQDAFQGKMWRGLSLFRSFATFVGIGAAAFGVAMIAYNNNLFGFRDAVDETVGTVVKRWNHVSDVFRNNRLDEIAGFDRMEQHFAKIQGMFTILGAIFGSDDGTSVGFTKKQWDLLEAIGMDDDAVTLTMLKGRLEAFFEGIADAFSVIVDTGKDFYNHVLKPMGDWLAEHVPLIDNWSQRIGEMFGFEVGKSEDVETWRKIGEYVGYVVGGVTTITLLWKTFDTIAVKPFKKIRDLLSGSKNDAKDIARELGKLLGSGDGKSLTGRCMCCCCNGGMGAGNGNGKDGGGGTVMTDPTGRTKPGDVAGQNKKRTWWDRLTGKNKEPYDPYNEDGTLKPRSSNPKHSPKRRIGGKIGRILGGATALGGLGAWIFGNKSEKDATDDIDSILDDIDPTNVVNTAKAPNVSGNTAKSGLRGFLSRFASGILSRVPVILGATALGATVFASGSAWENSQYDILQGRRAIMGVTDMNKEAWDRMNAEEAQARKRIESIVTGTDFLTIDEAERISDEQIAGLQKYLQGIKDEIRNQNSTLSYTPYIPPYVRSMGHTLPGYAEGTIVDKPHVAVFGEDGEEAVIPLSSKHRKRGLALWMEAGRRLGVMQYAEGAIAGSPARRAPAAPSGGAGAKVDASVTINNLNVSINGGNITNPREHAILFARELRKVLREYRSKGVSNMTLEELIMEI